MFHKKKKWLPFAIIGSLLLIFVTVFVFITLSHSGKGNTLPDRPEDSTVLDVDSHLSNDTIDTIDSLNRKWKDTKEQLQVAVYIADGLPSNDLEDFSNELFRKWKVGFKETNNGALVVIDVKNHKSRIETSNNVSTKLTDIEAKDILDNARPYFRNTDYSGGIKYIVEAIGDSFYGTQTATNLVQYDQDDDDDSDDDGDDSYDFESLLGIFVFLSIIFAVFRGGGGRNGGDDDDSGGFFGGSSGGFDGGGSDWSSGGSDWSGGGGDGGGASSDW